MTERLYLDRPDVYILADCDPRQGGRVLHVVCEHPSGATYAAHLAATLHIPLQRASRPVRPAPTGAGGSLRHPPVADAGQPDTRPAGPVQVQAGRGSG